MEKKKKVQASETTAKNTSLAQHLTARIMLADLVIVVLTVLATSQFGKMLRDGSLNTLTYAGCMIGTVAFIGILVLIFTPKVAARLLGPIGNASKEVYRLSAGNVECTDLKVVKSGMEELDNLQRAIGDTVTYLNQYITNIDDTLDRISNSDLAFEITEDYVGDFAKLKDSMNKIVDSLNGTIKGIGSVSGEVLSISEQVSSSSQALAQGATEQASAVEELLSTVNGISSHVGETASNAGEANQKASEVREQITRSNEQMQTLIGAMDQISTTSNQVAKIVKIIEDIAFQTNILALNAAVEAARAGVNGKSFAVVADEVKNLATKSASAAEDTTKLIKDTISAVENGMTISTETADLLSKVVDSVDDVANIVSTISGAAQEENASISQVVQGLDQVSTVVQANSSSAEESAAVSHQLADSAKKLQDMVGTFRLRA